MAPLWAKYSYDIDDTGIIFLKMEEDPEVLQSVRRMIVDRNPALVQYEPKVAGIATWYRGALQPNNDRVGSLSTSLKLLYKYT